MSATSALLAALGGSSRFARFARNRKLGHIPARREGSNGTWAFTLSEGKSGFDRGRGLEIHYNVYFIDPKTGKPRRYHRSRVVGYPPKMRKAEAESILAAELAAVNGGPVARVAGMFPDN
jgi:hypothetical protein